MLLNAQGAYREAEWSVPEDFLTKAHYRRAVARLDWKSSPGYPYCYSAATNGDWFKVVDGVPNEGRLEEMWIQVQSRLKGEVGPDPIRLFVKPEPHKLKKIETGRFRLISSVSVADQIIDHMLFGDMNDALIGNWPMHPSKPGWSQLNGGWKLVPPRWVALDKSAWDWTARVWLLELCLALRMLLCRNLNEEWVRLARQRYTELFQNPEFTTSGGLILRQRRPGAMKSGCVNTIADNSIMQYFLHLRVCIEGGHEIGELWSMGDDTLQEPIDRPREYFGALSQFCIVKEIVKASEFAGCRFIGRRIEPLYKGKHAFVIRHLNDSDPEVAQQFAEAYQLLYHRSADRAWMNGLLRGMGFKLRSGWYCDAIYDGE